MKIGKLNVDFETLSLAYPGMDGTLWAPENISAADAVASKSLYREQRWRIYEFECQTGSETRRRIDSSGRLILGPAFIVFGTPQKNGNIFTAPDRKSRQATYDAFMKASGFAGPRELATALAKQLGADHIPVPWSKIRANHSLSESFEVWVDVDMTALRIVAKGAGIPGDVFLLLPMKAHFTSNRTGVCEGEYYYDSFMFRGEDFVYDAHRVQLPGKDGRQLQREEAKRRIDVLEKKAADIREFGAAYGDEDDQKELLDDIAAQIEEYMKT